MHVATTTAWPSMPTISYVHCMEVFETIARDSEPESPNWKRATIAAGLIRETLVKLENQAHHHQMMMLNKTMKAMNAAAPKRTIKAIHAKVMKKAAAAAPGKAMKAMKTSVMKTAAPKGKAILAMRAMKA